METTKQYFNFDDGTTSIFSSHQPYFCSDFEAYGSGLLSHIKEQNKLQALDESDYGRGSDTMLLSWLFVNSQDKRDLSHTTCDKEMNLLLTLITPLYDHNLSMRVEPYPLPLSYIPKCFDISEDHDTYTSCNANDGISLQHNNRVINKVFS